MSYGKGYGRRGDYDKQHRGGPRSAGGSRSKQKPVIGSIAREFLEKLDSDSPIIVLFMQYSSALDAKHDRYERIVKISRDVTIESKRIISLLHTIDRDSKRDAVLQEAESRLKQLITMHFRDIALELNGQDPYEYLRAYTAGLQEFIEALTFHSYLKSKHIQHWDEIAKQLTYKIDPPVKQTEDSLTTMELEGVENQASKVQRQTIQTLLPPSEYMLGIGDLTGELMRKCINNVGSGNIEGCFETCGFVKEIYNGFLGINCTGIRVMKHKVHVLQQSLRKMENACYVLHVRGSEIPKEMLVSVFSAGQDDAEEEDEGFY